MSFTGDDSNSEQPRRRDLAEEPPAPDHLQPNIRFQEPRLLTRRDPSLDEEISHERLHLVSAEDTPRPIEPLTPPPSPRRKTALRRLLAIVAVLVILVVVALAAAAVWLRHSMRAALPQTDGTLHVAGLSAPVTVTRNAQGVPSIDAANLDDLLFAQGFVTAQDRLWQMDILRRHAAGELAEILGPGLIKHDKLERYLQLRAAADRATQNLPPDQLHQLQAYARGVNAFISTHRNRLPVEFHLLHYAPRPWTPRDSLLVSLVMAQDLSTSFPLKLDREALAHHLPRALLADLYPTGSWRDRPPTQPPTDLTAPRIIEQIPLDSSQSKLETPNLTPANAHDLLSVTTALSQPHCEDCRSGSNNWAVSGAHSASGAPLVSNDMHLGLSVPDIWYETSLHSPAASAGGSPIAVAGFTLPGLPWVLAGRNAHVAWSFTNLGADVQDVRIEHLRGSGAATEYEQPNGSWSPVQHHAEHIVVRGGRDISLDIETVAHPCGSPTAPAIMESPIISPLYPSEHRALSLAWTVYDPGASHEPFLGVDTATDGASLVAAFASFGGPSLNLVYADDQGHIGYHAVGRIPIRGPAIQHPYAAPQFVMPDREPDSDEDDEDGTQAQLSTGTPIAPHLLFTAYEPVRDRRRTRRKHIHPRRKPQQPQPALSTQQLPTPPVAENFTIGSPISPVPVDALDANQVWSGYIPYDDLPAIQDPPSGVLATANARITPDNYPYAITLDWADPYRAERIYHLLDGRNGLTPRSMLRIETDQHSEFDLLLAQRIAYAIDHASPSAHKHDAARLRQAANLLRNWQGEMSADSPAAAIVAATHAELWPMLLVPQIVAHDHCSESHAQKLATLYAWHERTSALETLLEHTPKRWLPRGVASWNDLLAEATDRALHNADAPQNLSHWTYGDTHTIDIENPIFRGHRLLRWILGAATGTGPRPAGGDTTTIDAIGPGFGPSERFNTDLASPASTLSNITTGESGNPASPWYLDQFLPWLRGTSFPLPLNRDNATHTLTLLPG